MITQLECGWETVINSPNTSEKPVGILTTPVIRLSVLCIIQKSGALPAQRCCDTVWAQIWDRFSGEEGWGDAVRVNVPSAELPSVSYSTDGFPKGKQAGMTAPTLLMLGG